MEKSIVYSLRLSNLKEMLFGLEAPSSPLFFFLEAGRIAELFSVFTLVFSMLSELGCVCVCVWIFI